MSAEELVRKLREAIINCEETEVVKEIAEQISKKNIDPVDVIQNHLVLAMKEVGDRFERGEYFLTHMMIAADGMQAATEILTGSLKGEDRKTFENRASKAKKVVIGTVKGDIHDIGKNMVAFLLRANGFNVFDLGKDVSPKSFVDEAEKIGADVIALSALLTVTRPFQADVISLLRERGIREKFKVVVGGGPTSPEWATSIGADDWAEDASGAIKIIKRMFPN